MLRSAFLKTLALILVIATVTSLFACETTENPTEQPTVNNTEETSATVEETNETTDENVTTGAEDTSSEEATSDVEVGSDETSEIEETSDVEETIEEETTEEETTEEEKEFQTTVHPDNCTKHAFRERYGTYLCIKCGFEPACKGDHPYVAVPEGHYKDACDICGKEAGTPNNHEYAEDIEDEGDLLLYSFACGVCKNAIYEQEVPYEINLFYSPSELSELKAQNAGNTLGAVSSEMAVEPGIGYGKFSTAKAENVTVTVMQNGEGEDPTGRYMVIKLRLASSQNSFKVKIKSVHATKDMTLEFDGIKNGWVTIVVDLSHAYSTKTGYTPAATGEYYLSDLQIQSATGIGESIDISYLMFCDNIEDASAFVGKERIVYTYDDIMAGTRTISEKPCYDADGNLVDHGIIDNGDGTHTITNSCSICGIMATENKKHIYMEKYIDVNGVEKHAYSCIICDGLMGGEGVYVNKLLSANNINADAAVYWFLTGKGIRVDKANNVEYAHFVGQAWSNGTRLTFARTGGTQEEADAKFDVGTARYVVIKMRTNTDNPITMSISTINSTASKPVYNDKNELTDDGRDTDITLPTDALESNAWGVYVIDIQALAPDTYIANGDGSYTVDNFYLTIHKKFSAQRHLSVSYIAFLDDWKAVAGVVDDETVVKVTDVNGGCEIVKTEDGSPIS